MMPLFKTGRCLLQALTRTRIVSVFGWCLPVAADRYLPLRLFYFVTRSCFCALQLRCGFNLFSARAIKVERAGQHTPSPERVGHCGQCSEGDRAAVVLKTEVSLWGDSRVQISHSVVSLLPPRAVDLKSMNTGRLSFSLFKQPCFFHPPLNLGKKTKHSLKIA